MIKLQVDIDDLLDAKARKKLLQLNTGQRKRLNRKLGRYAINQSRERLRNQNDVRGGKLAKSKTGKKVLAKQGNGMVVYASADKATITWKNDLTGSIAFQHHYGIAERWTASKAKRLFGQPDYKAPATREQARSLLAVGFKIKAKKGTKRPSQKWIMDNMTIGVAGAAIKKLRKAPTVKSWIVPIKKRQFLGATQNDVMAMVEMITKTVMKK